MASIHPNRSQCADVCRWRALLGRISIPQRGYPCVHLQTAFIRIDRRYGACVILAIDCTAQTAHSADAPHTTLLSKFCVLGKVLRQTRGRIRVCGRRRPGCRTNVWKNMRAQQRQYILCECTAHVPHSYTKWKSQSQLRQVCDWRGVRVCVCVRSLTA